MHNDRLQGILFNTADEIDLQPKPRSAKLLNRMLATKNALQSWQVPKHLVAMLKTTPPQSYAITAKTHQADVDNLLRRLRKS